MENSSEFSGERNLEASDGNNRAEYFWQLKGEQRYAKFLTLAKEFKENFTAFKKEKRDNFNKKDKATVQTWYDRVKLLSDKASTQRNNIDKFKKEFKYSDTDLSYARKVFTDIFSDANSERKKLQKELDAFNHVTRSVKKLKDREVRDIVTFPILDDAYSEILYEKEDFINSIKDKRKRLINHKKYYYLAIMKCDDEHMLEIGAILAKYLNILKEYKGLIHSGGKYNAKDFPVKIKKIMDEFRQTVDNFYERTEKESDEEENIRILLVKVHGELKNKVRKTNPIVFGCESYRRIKKNLHVELQQKVPKIEPIDMELQRKILKIEPIVVDVTIKKVKEDHLSHVDHGSTIEITGQNLDHMINTDANDQPFDKKKRKKKKKKKNWKFKIEEEQARYTLKIKYLTKGNEKSRDLGIRSRFKKELFFIFNINVLDKDYFCLNSFKVFTFYFLNSINSFDVICITLEIYNGKEVFLLVLLYFILFLTFSDPL